MQAASLVEQAEWHWKNWLPAQGKMLVILDDVVNAESIPEGAMPFDPRVQVLVTTRERLLNPSNSHFRVYVLEIGIKKVFLSTLLNDRIGLTASLDQALFP